MAADGIPHKNPRRLTSISSETFQADIVKAPSGTNMGVIADQLLLSLDVL